MSKLLSKPEYEKWIASTRSERMGWWREARFGMFIHYGLYALVGRNEWVMSLENIPIAEYEKLASQFNPKPGAPREWAKLAKAGRHEIHGADHPPPRGVQPVGLEGQPLQLGELRPEARHRGASSWPPAASSTSGSASTPR